MPARSLQHQDSEKKDPEILAKEARSHIASEPSLQLMAELLTKLRALDLPWWTPEKLRARWGAAERMRWYKDRWDLRQNITTELTGLAPKAARRKAPEFQAQLIDSVLEEGDISIRSFEGAYEPIDLVIYGPPSAFWHAFRESMPWEQDTPVHQELLAWLIKALLTDRSSFAGLGRVPILSSWDVRTAISGKVWHTRIPLDVRVAIDDARFKQEKEKPGSPFHAESDLGIALAEIIAGNVPLRELIPVLVVAEKAMAFELPKPEVKAEPAKASVDDAAMKSSGSTGNGAASSLNEAVAGGSTKDEGIAAEAVGSGPSVDATWTASATAPSAAASAPSAAASAPLASPSKPSVAVSPPVASPPAKPSTQVAPKSPVKPPPASSSDDLDNLDLSGLDMEEEAERTNPRLATPDLEGSEAETAGGKPRRSKS